MSRFALGVLFGHTMAFLSLVTFNFPPKMMIVPTIMIGAVVVAETTGFFG